VRFKVITAVTMNVTVFKNVTHFHLVSVCTHVPD